MKKRNIKWISLVAILSTLSTIVMLFEIPLWFAPGFYKLDFSEVFVLLGAFSLGPAAGVAIEGIKVLLNLLINGTITMGVGELANFLIGISFVLPASIIYHHKKTKKNALIGMLVGTLSMTLVGSLLNAFLLLPVYALFLEMDLADLIHMGTMVNPGIHNLFTLIAFAVAPFNLIKGTLTSMIVFAVYKRVSFIIKGHEEKDSD